VTCPQFPFPPGTPLFARHDYIRAYHIDFASHYHLLPNIHLNHNVLSASWVGNSSYGHWNVTASRATDGSVFHKSFDHIIVAAGNNHHPYSPTWEGVEGWRANTPPGSPKRDILHSLYYRDPEQWRGRTVIVVGGSASGRDISTGLEHSARKVRVQPNEYVQSTPY
jgi:cation diffusion facilitator CzcD-associated flavoprotein CzcO